MKLRTLLAGAAAAAALMLGPAPVEAVATDAVLGRALGLASVSASASASLRGIDDIARHVWKGDMVKFIRNIDLDKAAIKTLQRGGSEADDAAALLKKLDNASPDEARALRAANKAVLEKAMKELVDEYDRVGVVFQDSLKRIATNQGDESFQAVTNTGLQALVKDVVGKLDGGAKIHPAILDIDTAATVAANQILAAKRLTGKIPEGFKTIDGLEDVLAAINRRKYSQSLSGKMYTLDNGYFVSLSRSRNAESVMARLRQGAVMDELDAVDLRELTLAYKKKPSEVTEYQKALRAAFDDGAEARKVTEAGRTKLDDAADAAGDVASKSIKHIRRTWRRADFDAQVAAADMRLGGGNGNVKDLFGGVSSQVDQALKAGSEVRLGPSTDRLYAALQRKEALVHEARKANGGTLPSGVKLMTESEEEALKKLRMYFDNELQPLRDITGTFVDRRTLEYYAKLRKALTGSPEEVHKFFASQGRTLDKFLKQHLQYMDSEFEVSLRAALRRAKSVRVKTDVMGVNHIPGSDRVHGTGNMATLINYNDGPRTVKYVSFEGTWLEKTLSSKPVHRDLVKRVDTMPWKEPPRATGMDWQGNDLGLAEVVRDGNNGGRAAVMARLRTKYDETARALRRGDELLPEQVELVRRALALRPPTLPQDVVLARLARENDDVMVRVVNPGSTVAPKFPSRVAKKSEEAEAVARLKKEELAKSTADARKAGRPMADVLDDLDELQKPTTLSVWDIQRRTGSDNSFMTFAPAKEITARTWPDVLSRVKSAAAGKSFFPTSSKKLLEQLKKEQALWDEARKLNGGVLPKGMGSFDGEKREVIEALETYFKKERHVRAGTNTFYSDEYLAKVQKFEETINSGVLKTDKGEWVKRLHDFLKIADEVPGSAADAVQVKLLKTLREADKAGKIPLEDIKVEQVEKFYQLMAREPRRWWETTFSRAEFNKLVYPDGKAPSTVTKAADDWSPL